MFFRNKVVFQEELKESTLGTRYSDTHHTSSFLEGHDLGQVTPGYYWPQIIGLEWAMGHLKKDPIVSAEQMRVFLL